MMQASGILFLSQTKPLVTTALDGTFALTLLAYDRMDAHQVEPWRITWSGADAQTWWQANAQQLKAGQPIYASLKRLRTFSTAGRACEVVASVVLMYLAPVAQHVLARTRQQWATA